jgi:hypothetical protein
MTLAATAGYDWSRFPCDSAKRCAHRNGVTSGRQRQNAFPELKNEPLAPRSSFLARIRNDLQRSQRCAEIRSRGQSGSPNVTMVQSPSRDSDPIRPVGREGIQRLALRTSATFNRRLPPNVKEIACELFCYFGACRDPEYSLQFPEDDFPSRLVFICRVASKWTACFGLTPLLSHGLCWWHQ